MSFESLGVSPEIVSMLSKQGISSPFPIQIATIPDAIAGRDVLGRGQTGSGKTLAFGLPVLTRLAGRKAKARKPLALVLAPTRELAMQIHDALVPLAHKVSLNSQLIAGGMPYRKQIDALRAGVPILVATPGRLMDLMEKGEADLSSVEIVVLDEADQMVDLGFLPAVQLILNATPAKGQRLLFSATLDKRVQSLVKSYLKDPVQHSVNTETASVTTMDHHVLVMHPEHKDIVTAQIAARDGRTLFFVRTQRGADRLADKLALQGVPVGSLHGGKSQAVRTRTLNDFRSGETLTLVATDVAARGIHVDDISLVVHVDPPADPKDYLHRAGRTARAGESGTVVTLTTSKQKHVVKSLTEKAGVDAAFVRVEPHAKELVSITGSREPSGVPWHPKPEPSRSSGSRRDKPKTYGFQHGKKRYGGKRPA
ncbi:MAG: DEAD/DEAH box helicase [Actinobacteria bacterium]|nr:DEAD/DEAH box helicase [Actinomycetota bacterium]